MTRTHMNELGIGSRSVSRIFVAALVLLAGCASSGDVEQARQESAQAKAKMRAELQQERALAASMEKESEARKAEAEKLSKALGGKGGGKLSSLGASGSCGNTQTNQLAVQVVNDSGLPDSQVYVLLSAAGSTIGWPSGTWPNGGSPPPGTLSYYDNTTKPTVTAGALSNLTSSICGTITSPYTGVSLSVYQFAVSAISGGRLMVSYGTPVAINNGAFPNGTETFRWDKMEFGYPNSGADLTSMDFFGIPMQFDYLDSSNNVLNTMTYYTSTWTLYNALLNMNIHHMGEAFVPNQSGQITSGAITGATNASPIVVTTTSSTPPATGTVVTISGVQGNTAANGTWIVTNNGSNQFTLIGSNGTQSGSYTGHGYWVGGTVRVMGPSLLASTPSSNGSPAPYPSFGAYLNSIAGQTQPAFTVSGAGNAGCANQVSYTYQASFASDGNKGYNVTLQGTTSGVTGVTITNPGSSYSSPPTVAFTGGGGSGAQGTAVLSNKTVTGVTITNPGSSYSSPPTVAFTGGGGSGAQGTAQISSGPPCGVPPGAITATGTAVTSNQAVTGVTITNPGTDYFGGAPTVTFAGGGGSGASGTANLNSDGTVASVTMTNNGTGYTSAPAVTFSPPPPPPQTVNLPANLTVTVSLPAPSQNGGYDVNLYGAPATAFTVSGATLTPQQQSAIPNSLYAVIAGDFMAGMNFGYAGKGSNAPQNTANWYSNPPTLYPFGGARTTNDGYYNPYAAVFYNLSDAYGFAYSDRGGRPSPYVPLPKNTATTMRVMILNDTRLDAPLVTVSNPTKTSLPIAWPSVSNATGYTVNVSYGGGIPVPNATISSPTQSGNTFSATISGLSAGTTYQISVTATGPNSIRSYTVPVYGTTSGTIPSPTGSASFLANLSWPTAPVPSGLGFTLNNRTYTPPNGPNVTVNGTVPTSTSTPPIVYGLTVTNSNDNPSTIFQGNYVVTVGSDGTTNFILTPPNQPNQLNAAWSGGGCQSFPCTIPNFPPTGLVLGGNFQPVALKQVFSVQFPSR